MEKRTVLWIFLAFVLGFILPVCSCAGIGLVAVNAVGQVASGPAMPSIGRGDAVAVIELNGIITSDQPQPVVSSALITPERVENLLDQAANLDQVKAVVVQVNSPGGSVVASDEIYHICSRISKNRS